jgi:hypothetical protein
MELYTLISLVLGVSGGTYAALTAFRNQFDPTFIDGLANRENHLSKVKERHPIDGIVFNTCQNKRNHIGYAHNFWRICHVVPALAFIIFIFIVFFSALTDWGQIDMQHSNSTIVLDSTVVFTNIPTGSTNNSMVSSISTNSPIASNNLNYKQLFPWRYSHLFLWILGIVDTLCLAGAFSAWLFCFFAKKHLKLQFDGVLDIEKAEARKLEAAKIEKIPALTQPPPNNPVAPILS